jgi:hypothetical protein
MGGVGTWDWRQGRMRAERGRGRGSDGLEGRDIAGFGLFEMVEDDIPFIDELRKLGCIPG